MTLFHFVNELQSFTTSHCLCHEVIALEKLLFVGTFKFAIQEKQDFGFDGQRVKFVGFSSKNSH